MKRLRPRVSAILSLCLLMASASALAGCETGPTASSGDEAPSAVLDAVADPDDMIALGDFVVGQTTLTEVKREFKPLLPMNVTPGKLGILQEAASGGDAGGVTLWIGYARQPNPPGSYADAPGAYRVVRRLTFDHDDRLAGASSR